MNEQREIMLDRACELPNDFIKDLLKKIISSTLYQCRTIVKLLLLGKQWRDVTMELYPPKPDIAAGDIVSCWKSRFIVKEVHLDGMIISLGNISDCQYYCNAIASEVTKIENPKTVFPNYAIKDAPPANYWRPNRAVLVDENIQLYSPKKFIYLDNSSNYNGWFYPDNKKIGSSRDIIFGASDDDMFGKIIKIKPGDRVDVSYMESVVEGICLDRVHSDNTPAWVNPKLQLEPGTIVTKRTGETDLCRVNAVRPCPPIGSITIKNELIRAGIYLVILEKDFPLCLVEGVYKLCIHLTCTECTDSPWYVTDFSQIMFKKFDDFESAYNYQTTKREELKQNLLTLEPGDHILLSSTRATVKSPQKYHTIRKRESITSKTSFLKENEFLTQASDNVGDLSYHYYYTTKDYVETQDIVDVIKGVEVDSLLLDGVSLNKYSPVKKGHIVTLLIAGCCDTPSVKIERVFDGGIVVNGIFYDTLQGITIITENNPQSAHNVEPVDFLELAMKKKEEKKKKAAETKAKNAKKKEEEKEKKKEQSDNKKSEKQNPKKRKKTGNSKH
jgi:hypothetical protein